MEDRPLNLAPASVADYRELARRRLPRQLFDYIDGGAYRETTMRANLSDLRDVRLRQRVLRDVSDIDLSADVLGERLSLPVVLAPVGLIGMFARRGEVQAARAAERRGPQPESSRPPGHGATRPGRTEHERRCASSGRRATGGGIYPRSPARKGNPSPALIIALTRSRSEHFAAADGSTLSAPTTALSR